uniref:Bm1485, isoform c n=1 Tax=Brugia malayi TaxID=6279 RepID=A0A1I9G4N3_BRUMA|nr:Bm1485, isoform c [Brugia malayi]
MNVNVDPRMRQKLMSTRSRHRKERISLPLNSRRFRFSKFQSSGQQSTNINVNNEIARGRFVFVCSEFQTSSHLAGMC